MPSEEDIKAQQELLTAYRRTLIELLKQRALLSELLAPPGIANGIRDTREQIRRIKSSLRAWGVSIEDFPNDEEAPSPPLEPVTSESFRAAAPAKSRPKGGYIRVLAVIVSLGIVGVVGLWIFMNANPFPQPASPTAGPLLSATAFVPSTNAPPTSAPPTSAPPKAAPVSGSCLDGFVWRLAGPDDKTCVTPDVYEQAQADNAAAAERREVASDGPDTCVQGYVWRNAFPGDVVCVTTELRAQAEADNAAAAERLEPGGGASGADCKSGYVWRVARPEDLVCVTPETRDQTAADNQAANSRKLLQYGPDTCKQGYVWRNAFPGDVVCVTTEVRAQAEQDNSLAASRTVP